MILVNKVLYKLKFSNNVNNKRHAPKLIFSNEKKLRKIRIIFDRQKLAFFDHLIFITHLSYTNAEVDRKFLNVMYYPVGV